MNSTPRPCLSMFVAFAVVTATFLTETAQAQQHVVPLPELHGALQSSADQRAKDISDIQRVLSYPAAADALRKAKVNPDQMRMAVATLTGAELARLANQARASEADVQGGFIVGILALIGLIVVIIIILAVVADARPVTAASTDA